MGNQVQSGKSFEFSIIKTLTEHNIGDLNDDSIHKIEQYYNEESELLQKQKDKYSNLAIEHIKKLEPNLYDKKLHVKSMSDNNGISGDVRDIVITNEDLSWELGISAKNNSNSVKHSRISRKINFGSQWIGINNTEDYFNEINPIFDKLETYYNIEWKNLKINKEQEFYVPLLNAFINEVNRLAKIDESLFCNNIISYLIGKKDFYKIINHKKYVKVEAYNFNGSLGIPFNGEKTPFKIPKTPLPDKIIDISFKEKSKNTILIKFDKGWEISLRIHNASSRVENSMKFDVKLIGIPTNIYVVNLY